MVILAHSQCGRLRSGRFSSLLKNRMSFRDGPPGRGPESMYTGQAIDFFGSCSWIPGSRAKPAPRNDNVPAFLRTIGLLARRVDGAGIAPIAGRNLIDEHVCLPIGWPFFDAIDDIVDAFDDLTPLIERERPFGYVDLGDRHDSSLSIRDRA